MREANERAVELWATCARACPRYFRLGLLKSILLALTAAAAIAAVVADGGRSRTGGGEGISVLPPRVEVERSVLEDAAARVELVAPALEAPPVWPKGGRGGEDDLAPPDARPVLWIAGAVETKEPRGKDPR